MGRYRSKLEAECAFILEYLFPNVIVEHDYNIGEGLLLDFYVRSNFPIAVEVDGPQHKEYNSHFHKNLADFQEQVKRDRRKEAICAEMGVPLVRLDKKDLHTGIVHDKIMAALSSASTGDCRPRPVKKQDPYRNKRNEWAKERRKEQYKWIKEQRKKR